MSNSTAAVTSGPARDPRPASSAPAMKRRSKARSKAKSFRPRGRFLRDADPFRRPVGEERSTDDPILGDGAPGAAVGGVPTVVAHHKKVIWRNPDLAGQVARFARFVRTNPRLVLAFAVDVDPPLLHAQPVTGHPDDALDEVGVGALLRRELARCARSLLCALHRGVVVGALRRLEDDDVSALGVAEARRDPVDQHTLPDGQGGLHRLARDPERLDEELLDAQGESERHHDDDDELEERTLAILGASRAAGHWRRLSGQRRGSGVVRLGRGFVGRVGLAGTLGVRIGRRSGVARLRGVLRLALATGLGGHGVAFGIARRRALLGGRLALGGRLVDLRLLRQHRRRLLTSSGVERLGHRGAGVLALAHACAAADATAQVVELRPPDVPAGRDLDALDLRRVHGERSLDAYTERLLADGEGLARALPLALDHDALEDLGTAAGALDDLEVDLHAVTGLEGRDLAQLGALEAVDNSAHRKRRARGHGPPNARRRMVAKGWRSDAAWDASAAVCRAGSRAALLEPPLADPRVVTGQEDRGHLVAPPALRAGVVRVLRRAAERGPERFLDRAVLVPQRAGQLSHHGVADHHRGELPSSQDVAANRDDVGGQVLVHTLVEALVATAEQSDLGLRRQLAGQRVVEGPAAGCQGDDAPPPRGLDGVDAVAALQGALDHVDADHHPGAAAVRGVVDPVVRDRGRRPQVDPLHLVTLADHVANVPLLIEPVEPAREEREDVDAQGSGLVVVEVEEGEVDVDLAAVEVDVPHRIADERDQYRLVPHFQHVAGRAVQHGAHLAQTHHPAADEVVVVPLVGAELLAPARHLHTLAAQPLRRVAVLHTVDADERPRIGAGAPGDRRSRLPDKDLGPLRQRVRCLLDVERAVQAVRAAYAPGVERPLGVRQSTTSTRTRRPCPVAHARITVRNAFTVRPWRPMILPTSSSATVSSYTSVPSSSSKLSTCTARGSSTRPRARNARRSSTVVSSPRPAPRRGRSPTARPARYSGRSSQSRGRRAASAGRPRPHATPGSSCCPHGSASLVPTKSQFTSSELQGTQRRTLASAAQLSHRRHLALLELAHHLLHLPELLDELVDRLDAGPRPARDPAAARTVQDLRVGPLLGRHRRDDRLQPVELAVV